MPRRSVLAMTVLALAGALACQRQEPSPEEVRIHGVTIRLKPGDAQSYVGEGTRYARVPLTAETDLALDERFDWNVPADFMSSIPVAFGQGERRRLGRFELACAVGSLMLYRCGIHSLFRSMPFVLLFKTPPQSEAEVAAQVAAADAFLRRRVAPDGPSAPRLQLKR
ncbi:hypothetical protein [Sphingomonas jinjuensis]|nr:hypothetical protein [Sphingomonas jinjuensis]